ncbi:MAG: hypothetical protein E4H31_02595 [Dehalococcoidia bacterium]|nr:MAG: hypothetical protein E4H31_02595 [Dehalococcoidia bacterium]
MQRVHASGHVPRDGLLAGEPARGRRSGKGGHYLSSLRAKSDRGQVLPRVQVYLLTPPDSEKYFQPSWQNVGGSSVILRKLTLPASRPNKSNPFCLSSSVQSSHLSLLLNLLAYATASKVVMVFILSSSSSRIALCIIPTPLRI